MDTPTIKGRILALFVPETRSFDYVPLTERRGKVWHQGPFWFMIMAELLTIATGFVGGSVGLSFGWSLLAITIGVLFGTIFVAFHGNQGPRVGLPQMVQSRAQFGTRGLVVPSAMVVFLYVGFTIFDVLLAVPAIQTVWPIGDFPLTVLVVGLTWLVALIGHDFLHLVERWLGYITVIVFAVLTFNALAQGIPTGSGGSPSGFVAKAFFLQLAVAAAYAIGFAVYVSDYTRYLPKATPARGVVGWVYAGNAVGMVWFMGIGALLIAQYPGKDIIPIIHASGDTLFGGFGILVLMVSIPGLIMVQAVNMYGSTLTTAGAIDAFKRLRATLGLRVWIVSVTCLLVLLMSLYLPSSFITAYSNYTTILLYFLVPWTAINLTDFYWVRRGHYAIQDLFAPDGGRYKQWQIAGLTAYIVGFCAMIPFFSNAYYVGPVANALGGSDISFVVGLPVAAVVYWAMTRNVDAREEAIVADQQSLAVESVTGPAGGPADGGGGASHREPDWGSGEGSQSTDSVTS